jgi:acetyl-CoA carboxylase biotin carboxyl carrier protein
MKRYDLTALDVNDGTLQIRLRRSSPQPVPASVTSQPQTPAPAVPTPSTGPISAQGRSEPRPGDGPAAKTVVIESPMVGTYYASSAPDAPPFVAVGSAVQPGSIVCIIEAMKVFTDIPAGVSGTVAEILVKNGQPVEYGQPLFRVIPA